MRVFKEQFGRDPDEQERKVLYQGAHGRSGTPSEKAHAEKKYGPGFWPKWSAWCRGMEAKVEKGPFASPPPDPDVRPIPHGHGDLAATDSALRLALDRESTRQFDRDGRMHVDVANICKACVSPYRGDEIPGHEELGLMPDKIYNLLRPAEEIEKAAPTANGIQILKRHVPVDASDHKPYDIVGATGSDARFEYPYLKNSLHFWTKQAIDDIESEEKRSLSPGYHYVPVMESGVFDGEPYQGRMTRICFNHLSQVEDGRQGGDIIVGDSVEGLKWALIEGALVELALI
jgi:hypothetical protein